ncbi:MAG: HAMP domain-containing protein, partial [Alphaproteobacteria bacterium]|nr:HAMP domain-containing protein [Alphaproteobacteria bacterium]
MSLPSPLSSHFRILHTFTFRLGLVYMALFSLSVVLLFGFIYTFAVNYLDNQLSDAIRLRHSLLMDEYRVNGSAGLEARIGELIESDDEGAEIYLLINNKGERLAGNLETWPQHVTLEGHFEKDGQWIRFSIEGTRNHPASIGVQAVTVPLSKWRTLLVGQTMISKRKVEQTIAQAFWASLAVTLLMAFLGAVIVTRSVVHRLSVINRSADTIMHGQFSARIPFTPGGDEFDELSLHLNSMLDRTEALMKSLSDIVNNIAHDLRSPLSRIVARTEAGLRGMKEGSAARRLLERNVEDMNELIGTFNSILHLSELEANTDFHRFQLCDLQLLVEQLAEFYEPLAAEKGIALENRLRRPLLISGESN